MENVRDFFRCNSLKAKASKRFFECLTLTKIERVPGSDGFA
jgi:hypothetical protein